MVNAQEWLANKEQVERIELVDFEQSSELIIDGYPNLKEIEKAWREEILNITKIIITNCPQLENVIISKVANNQQLILNNLPSLKEFWCVYNNLTTLDLTTCPNLERINCSNNQLTEIKLPTAASEKLNYLDLSNNNFPKQDLSFLSRLVNLEELYLGNWNKKGTNQSIYNHFKGSLEFLQDLSRLKNLDISSTDVDSGLEYLPDNINNFYCSIDKREDVPQANFIYNLFANEEGVVEKDQSGFECIKNFPQKLQEYKQWRKLGFTEGEIKEWIKIGLKTSDYDFAKQWKNVDFNAKQTKVLLGTEFQLSDYQFINWLKSLTPEWIISNQEAYQSLVKRFKEYGLCSECNHPKNTKYWCRTCNSSGSSEVDDFIEKYQQKATNYKGIVEWIPYEKFTDIEHIANGGFGKIYKAKWNHKDKDDKKKSVALKCLNDSADIKEDFLQEIANHKMFTSVRIVKCHGISQDPETKNYLMIMDYIKDGDLRDFLKNSNQLSFEEKLAQLWRIADGLKQIHKLGLTHRDFHPGNILNRNDKKKGKSDVYCFITDLGLCKPANEMEQEKVYGVLPYVAPEVLTGQGYTQAADVYSFGIVAVQTLTGLPPYYEYAHDATLAVQICQGQRPEFNIKIPILLEELIKNCLDSDLSKRPTAEKLYKDLHVWLNEVRSSKDTTFAQQLQKAKAYNQNLPGHIKNPKYKIHKGAIYTSRLLPTKEITQLLQNSQLILQKNKSSELLISKQIAKIDKLSEEIKQNSRKKSTSELTIYFLEKSKELTKELEEILASNPNISKEGKEALKKIKKLKDELKSQNSSFLEENNIFEEQEIKINYLESRIQELTYLIKQRKEKIIQDFINVLPEKELIQQLITTYLEFKKTEKQNASNSLDLEDKYMGVKKELRKKLGTEFVKEIQPILIDCETLVNYELELEEKLENKSFLIEEQRKLLQITSSSKNQKQIVEKFEVNWQNERLQEAVFQESYLKSQLGKVEEIVNQQNLEQQVSETGLTTNFKRQLSLETQTKTTQEKTKSIKIDQNQVYHSEPMEIDYNWTNLHKSFNQDQIQNWQKTFTYNQAKDWINIGLTPADYQLAHFLQNQKNLTPEQTLNHHNLEELKQEFHQSQQTTQILQALPPKTP